MSFNFDDSDERGELCNLLSELDLAPPPQTSSDSFSQQSQKPQPWAPDFAPLPTRTLVNTNNFIEADYPDYGPPPSVPNAWKGSQGYGWKIWYTAKLPQLFIRETYEGREKGLEVEKKKHRPKNNGKAEVDEIPFTPRHQVQLMLAGRLYGGASIDNTSPHSISLFDLLPREACLITLQKIHSIDSQVWIVA
jgi:hypothetical protein